MIVTGVRLPHAPPTMTFKEPPYKDLELYVTEDESPTLRERYVLWSSLHTMNPFAWPWVIYESILIWRNNRAQKD
jgi:hypothetical protein